MLLFFNLLDKRILNGNEKNQNNKTYVNRLIKQPLLKNKYHEKM